MSYDTLDTPIGKVGILAENEHLVRIYMPSELKSVESLDDKKRDRVMDLIKLELSMYFEGKLDNFSIPVSLESSEFNTKVWKEVRNIEYGKTASYKDISVSIGQPKAYRAVGNSNGKNPIPIVIPCHRVIACNGNIGGYKDSKKIKQALLDLEDRYKYRFSKTGNIRF